MRPSFVKFIKGQGMALAYSPLVLTALTTLSHATLEDQIDKASTLVLGKAAALLIGGGAVVGGAVQIKAGNIMMGAGILGLAAITGITVAMIKNQSIFNLLT